MAIFSLFLTLSIQSAFAYEGDCVRINLEKLKIERRSLTDTYQLTDGKKVFHTFRLEMNARRILRAMQNLDMSQQCYLDREEKVFPFYLTTFGHPPSGVGSSVERCDEFGNDFETRMVRRWFRTRYLLEVTGIEGKTLELGVFVNQEDAYKAQGLIDYHGFTEICYDNQRNPDFTYFK